MTNSGPRAKAGPITEAAGAALLVVAFAVEVLQQQPRWVMRFSLGAAVVLITAAALSNAVRRAWLAALSGLALILAVSQLVRMTKEPLFNGLNIVPLLLIGCAAMLGRSAVSRRRALARELAQARSDGEERERRRWARELHDETLQELVAVQIVLSTAVGVGQSAATNKAINQARGLIANQITSLRHLIVEMRPFALDQFGLVAALETLFRLTEETFGLDTELRVGAAWSGPGDELSPEAQAHIYRIVQEAVNNAVKHAEASHLLVELDSDDHALSVTVRDNGRGMAQRPSDPFDRTALRMMVSTGTGLPAMRERGHLLNGHLSVSSTPGEGTCVTLRVPRHTKRRSR
ncbi:sensor histidine kinase [Streptomyces pseudovenezuelae]|uniref:Oxygen sensor histidine kinase NreB n=1 Tax=Streptomyces pseudovenezuelae TaxID=67350 RepID=A0ABT6LJ99_9ACTN|nr:ATP-binding protein [Streptomyces pseudovenezuelae]MDH6215869.1 signal transduction histidine kinase [Streptomyces pseudovenezuelae]